MKCDQFMEHVRFIIMNRENIFLNNHKKIFYEKMSRIKQDPDLLRWAKE